MPELVKGEICVVGKQSSVFVGIFACANEAGVILCFAREVKNRDAVFIATFGLDESDMRNNVSPSMDELSIYRQDLLIKPREKISKEIAQLFKIEAIVNESQD